MKQSFEETQNNSKKQHSAEQLAAIVRYTKESSTHMYLDLFISPRGIHKRPVTSQEENWDAKKSGVEASELVLYYSFLLLISDNFI